MCDVLAPPISHRHVVDGDISFIAASRCCSDDELIRDHGKQKRLQKNEERKWKMNTPQAFEPQVTISELYVSRNNTNGKQPLSKSVTSCQTRQRMRIDCNAEIVTSGWCSWVKNVRAGDLYSSINNTKSSKIVQSKTTAATHFIEEQRSVGHRMLKKNTKNSNDSHIRPKRSPVRYLETWGGVKRRLTERPCVSLLPTLLPDQSLSVVGPRDHAEVSNIAAMHVIPELKAHRFVGLQKPAHKADALASLPLGGFNEKVEPWKDRNGFAAWQQMKMPYRLRHCSPPGIQVGRR